MSGFLKSNVNPYALKPALLSPKGYGEVVYQNRDNHFNWHQTVGVAVNEAMMDANYIDSFQELFPDSKITNPFDTDSYMDSPFVTPNLAMSKVGADVSKKYVTKYLKNKMFRDINNYIKTLPEDDERLTNFKTYDQFKEEELEKMRMSEYKTAMYSQYQKGGGFKKLTSPMLGMSVSGMFDPMFVATMPLTAFSGGATAASFLLRESVIGLAMGGIGQAMVETQVYPFKKRLGEENYTSKNVLANIAMVAAGGALLSPVLAGAIRYGAVPGVKAVFGPGSTEKNLRLGLSKMTENINKLDSELQAKIFDAEYIKLIESKAKTEDVLNYLGKKLNELDDLDQVKMFEQLDPEGAKQSKIIDEINARKTLEVENVYPDTKPGRKLHEQNQINAHRALLLDEEMKIVETDLPIEVRQERLKIREDNLKIATKILQNNQDTGLSTVVESQKQADDIFKTKSDEEYLSQFDNPDDIKIFGKSADDEFTAHANENPDYIYSVRNGEDADGNSIMKEISAKDLKADVANDVDIIKRLKDCV